MASLVAEDRLSDAWAQSSWHTGLVPHSMWNVSSPGIKPVSSVLAGGFLTARPPVVQLGFDLGFPGFSVVVWATECLFNKLFFFLICLVY